MYSYIVVYVESRGLWLASPHDIFFIVTNASHVLINNIMLCDIRWIREGSSLSWSYSCWIYNYICNQYLSPQKLWVWNRWSVLDTTLCDKVCQLLATDWWFSLGTPISHTNYTQDESCTIPGRRRRRLKLIATI